MRRRMAIVAAATLSICAIAACFDWSTLPVTDEIDGGAGDARSEERADGNDDGGTSFDGGADAPADVATDADGGPPATILCPTQPDGGGRVSCANIVEACCGDQNWTCWSVAAGGPCSLIMACTTSADCPGTTPLCCHGPPLHSSCKKLGEDCPVLCTTAAECVARDAGTKCVDQSASGTAPPLPLLVCAD